MSVDRLSVDRRLRFALYASSVGNYFFDEIRGILGCGLRDLGFQVVETDETRGFLQEADWHIVVAPHEFFVLGAGAALPNENMPRQLILYNTEQPGSQWFPLARQFMPRAYEVWELDRQCAATTRNEGFRAQHVPLGYSRRFDLAKPIRRLPKTQGTSFLEKSVRRHPGSWTLASRPIDIFFVGHLTGRRNLFFRRHAEALSSYRTFLHFSDAQHPVRPDRLGASNSLLTAGLSQRSKIVLNLHREQNLFFEWHRIALHGLGQRALVVTEPVSPAPPLRPGLDFVEAPMGDIPDCLEYFLRSPEGRREAQAIATRGFMNLSKNCRMSDILRPLIKNLARTRSRARLNPAPNGAGPLPEGSRLPARAFVEVRTVGKPLAKVTVAISLHNYRRHILPCLESVHRQTLAPLDIIVVDDASEDGSEQAVRAWFDRKGPRFRNCTLVRHKKNRGLAAARNSAFSRSRTEYVFVLDADNLLLPPCLERLALALDNCRADFAFSYHQRFGEEESLSNLKPWDPQRLRDGPYIDAMAMVRRSSWRQVGGYRALSVQGWEDYDFWLRIAALGGWGVLVPEILARYRVHMRSMIHTMTNPRLELIKPYFRRHHRALLGPGWIFPEPPARPRSRPSVIARECRIRRSLGSGRSCV